MHNAHPNFFIVRKWCHKKILKIYVALTVKLLPMLSQPVSSPEQYQIGVISFMPIWKAHTLWVVTFLYLKVISQNLQWIETPSRCLDSMWLFMWLLESSFPQTLHAYSVNPCVFFLGKMFSIIELICWSSFSILPEMSFGSAKEGVGILVALSDFPGCNFDVFGIATGFGRPSSF